MARPRFQITAESNVISNCSQLALTGQCAHRGAIGSFSWCIVGDSEVIQLGIVWLFLDAALFFRGGRARGASRPALRVSAFLSRRVLRPLCLLHVYAWQRRPLPPQRVLYLCLFNNHIERKITAPQILHDGGPENRGAYRDTLSGRVACNKAEWLTEVGWLQQAHGEESARTPLTIPRGLREKRILDSEAC